MSALQLLIPLNVILFAQTTAFAQDHTHSDEQPPLWSQADAYYASDEMTASRAAVLHHHGNKAMTMFKLDRAEFQFTDDETVGVWDAAFWHGGDLNKFYLTSEGEFTFDENEVEHIEMQALWSRALTTYFDLQAGLRYDIEPDGLANAVVGVQGVAPYWFEVSSAAYLSENGDMTADIEVEYDLLLSQRLILQPRVEAEFSAQDIPDQDMPAGMTDFDVGLRLRYEVMREFAPYIGVSYLKSYSDSQGSDLSNNRASETTSLIFGVRSWY